MSRTSLLLIISGSALLSLAIINLIKPESGDLPPQVALAFSEWRISQGKSYGTPKEFAYRASTFHKNYKKVSKHNPSSSYKLSLNKFADMTTEEFLTKHTGLKLAQKPRRNYKPLSQRAEEVGDLPESVDWRLKGAVNPIKDQGRCGSCWAFSAVQAIETGYWKANGHNLESFSEQQLVDCSRKEGNHGCNGGFMDFAFSYIERVGGLATEKNYPYTARDDRCTDTEVATVQFTVTDFIDLPPRSAEVLAQSVVYQPISVGIDASEIMLYESGVFDNDNCGVSLNHGVGLIGYGNDEETGKDYWIVRNSWGEVWGEKGYIRMRKDVKSKAGECGITLASSYPEIVV